jgi:hypothetical protein
MTYLSSSHASYARINRSGLIRPLFPTLARIALGLILLQSLSLLSAKELSEKSPFLPPGHGAKNEAVQVKPVVPAQGPLSREIEFRGVVQIGGVFQFSIFKKKDQKGYWLRENITEDGITARSYDAASSTLVVNMNGRSERLTLMTATDNPLPVAKVNPAATPSQPTRPPTITPPQPPQLNKSNANNSRRVVPRRRVVLPKTQN